MSYVINPLTKRQIKVGGALYNQLVAKGRIKTETTPESQTDPTIAPRATKTAPKAPTTEMRLKERDPALYISTKRFIKKMPDVRGFLSQQARASAGPWTDQKRWEYLLDDLERLDASAAVPTGDTIYVEYLNLFDPDDYDAKWVTSAEGQFELQEKLQELKFEVGGFIARYPALSWLLTRITLQFRSEAIFATPSYYQWVRDAKLSAHEQEYYPFYINDYEYVKLLLDPVSFQSYRDYPVQEHMREVAERKNIAVLRYLAERLSTGEGHYLHYFVLAGDIPTLKLALKTASNTNTVGKGGRSIYLEAAVESGSVEMLRFVETMLDKRMAIEDDFKWAVRSLIDSKSYEMLDLIQQRGYPISLEGIITTFRYASGADHSMDKRMVDYLLKDHSPSERAEIVLEYNEPPTSVSVFTFASELKPSVLQHFLDRYGASASEENWNEMLEYFLKTDETYMQRNPNYQTNDSDIEVGNILFSAHNYSQEQKDRWEALKETTRRNKEHQ